MAWLDKLCVRGGLLACVSGASVRGGQSWRRAVAGRGAASLGRELVADERRRAKWVVADEEEARRKRKKGKKKEKEKKEEEEKSRASCPLEIFSAFFFHEKRGTPVLGVGTPNCYRVRRS